MDALEQTALQVRAAQDGSKSAMESLFERYLPRVHAIVAARLGKRLRSLVEVEDVVQEAMHLAICSLERFEHRTEGAFRSWLATCIENAIRNESRKHAAAKRGAGRLQKIADLAQTRLAESLFADRGPTASEAARGREEEERIETALLSLDARYREVIVLRVHGQLSHREIAEAMDLPSENTANALFVRARRKLLRALEAGPE